MERERERDAQCGNIGRIIKLYQTDSKLRWAATTYTVFVVVIAVSLNVPEHQVGMEGERKGKKTKID